MQFRWPIRAAKGPAARTTGIVGSGESRLLCLRDPVVARRRSIQWRPCVTNKTNIEHPTSNAEHRRRGGAAVRTKAPNPNSKEAPNSKLQYGGREAPFGVCSLGFLWSLVFGIWAADHRTTSNEQPATDN